jgi:4-alpha-glucanotransferase
VVYTGTHDNDTTAGWFRSIPAAEKRRVKDYTCDGTCAGNAITWPLIRAALASVADTAIFPIQDLLGLDSAYKTLKQTLDEEKAADEKLTDIAEETVNIQAA